MQKEECKKFYSSLIDLANDELEGAERIEVEEHLKVCSHCRMKLKDIETMKEMVSLTAPGTAPAEETLKLQKEEIMRTTKQKHEESKLERFDRVVLKPLLLCLVALILFLLIVLIAMLLFFKTPEARKLTKKEMMETIGKSMPPSASAEELSGEEWSVKVSPMGDEGKDSEKNEEEVAAQKK